MGVNPLFIRTAFAVFLILGLGACQKPGEIKDTISEQPHPNKLEEEGGISGGGGDTSEKQPVELQELNYFISNKLKLNARLLLQAARVQVTDIEKGEFHHLLWGQPNLLDRLSDVEIIVQSEPCRFKGMETDAAAILPNQICMSTNRIAPKVSRLDFQVKVTALFIHELSHLNGADERLARLVQKRFEEYILPFSSDLEIVYGPTELMGWTVFNSVRQSLERLDSSSDLKDEGFNLLQVARSLNDSIKNSGGNYSLFDFDETTFLKLQTTKIELVAHYLFQTAGGRSAYYDTIFGPRNHLLLESSPVGFFNRSRDGASIYSKVPIKKLESIQEAKAKLVSVIDALFKVWQRLSFIRSQKNVPSFQSMLSQSPWFEFVGSYVVSDKKCQVTSCFEKLLFSIGEYSEFNIQPTPSLFHDIVPRTYLRLSMTKKLDPSFPRMPDSMFDRVDDRFEWVGGDIYRQHPTMLSALVSGDSKAAKVSVDVDGLYVSKQHLEITRAKENYEIVVSLDLSDDHPRQTGQASCKYLAQKK